MKLHLLLRSLVAGVALLLAPLGALGQTITVATYNIERFAEHFQGFHLSKEAVGKNPETKPLVDAISKANDEDNWEVADTILDKKFNPDILVIEEGCDQDDLTYFNEHWLKNAYKTALVFNTNTERHQNLAMMLKPGFQIIEKSDKYYLEPDPTGANERGQKLFARGPVFCVVQTPSGYKFWVGVTHQKSKSLGAPGERFTKEETAQKSKEATLWRNREAVRTHQIILELSKKGPADVMLLGDMNDQLGIDKVEQEAGGDTIVNLVGPPEDGLILATKPLADAKEFSFNGYWRTAHHELIDHIVITPSMKNRVEDVKIFNEGLAKVASDHFPVFAKVKTNP